MAKKKIENEINLLRRALRLAAVEAYQVEIVDTEMEEHSIGNDKEFPSVKYWLEERVETWIQQAELNI